MANVKKRLPIANHAQTAALGGAAYRARNAGTFEPVGWVPATRGDCPKERPCPHVRCPHHNWRVDGEDRAGRRHYDGHHPPTTLRPEWLSTSPLPSCSLDAIDARPPLEGMSAREVAQAIGVSKRRVEQILKAAVEKLRRDGVMLPELEHD